MPHRAPFALAVAATLVAIAPLDAQSPRKLGAPTATLEQEFTGIDGVRELKDGRVIVLDPRDKAIHLIDLKTKAGKQIGRDGDGPGEFRLPLEIWAIGGDSSVVRDMARFGKLMVITPTGEIGGFVSMVDSSLSTRSFQPRTTDLAGRVYGLEYTAGGNYDSARIVRWDRARGTRDTLARFMASITLPTMNEADVIRGKDGAIIGYRPGPPRPFMPFHQWAISADGRVAIILAEPYRVVYVNANGARVTGPVVPYKPVPVTDAEKAEWRAEASKSGPSISQSRGGPTVASYTKRTPPDNVVWADALPVFPRNAVTFASDGMLWVRRSAPAGAPALYDVFDRGANRAFQLELPPKTKLLGFGAGVVYLARVDEDDLHYLERYKLPGK